MSHGDPLAELLALVLLKEAATPSSGSPSSAPGISSAKRSPTRGREDRVGVAEDDQRRLPRLGERLADAGHRRRRGWSGSDGTSPGNIRRPVFDSGVG